MDLCNLIVNRNHSDDICIRRGKRITTDVVGDFVWILQWQGVKYCRKVGILVIKWSFQSLHKPAHDSLAFRISPPLTRRVASLRARFFLREEEDDERDEVSWRNEKC